jgi:hypothetical protein
MLENLRNIRHRILHPFMICIYFIFWINNERKNEFHPSSAVIALIILLSITGILLWIFLKLHTNRVKAACIFSLVLIPVIFFAYAKNFLGNLLHARGHASFIIIFSVITAYTFLLYRSHRSFRNVNLYLNYLLGILILHQFIVFISLLTNPRPEFKIDSPPMARTDLHGNFSKENIYLLLVDTYARPDNLRKYFGFDDRNFLSFLKENEFYIPSNTQSNYNNTLQTMSSMLNLTYLPENSYLRNNYNYASIKYDEALRKNFLVELLAQNQYKVINLSIFNMAKYPSPVGTTLHYFGLNGYDYYFYVYSKTVFAYFHQIIVKYSERHRESAGINLMHKEINRRSSQPKFVYFHSMICHEPYYFTEDGKPLSDSWFYLATNEAYVKQIKYANLVLKDIIQRIKKNDPQPIIILTSDHGFRNLTNVSMEEAAIESRQNFSAIYFPDQHYDSLYDSITPVNIMRVVLNRALHANFERLDERVE